ncbi:MAG: carboxypeptidase-like regulatory domain-containing protein, partial [bacterium]
MPYTKRIFPGRSVGAPLVIGGILICWMIPLQAQTSKGEIDVIVDDASQAVIFGARVTVSGADTGAIVRTLDTNASGLTAAPLLNPGTYDVKIEKDGFKTLVRKGIILRVTEVLS